MVLPLASLVQANTPQPAQGPLLTVQRALIQKLMVLPNAQNVRPVCTVMLWVSTRQADQLVRQDSTVHLKSHSTSQVKLTRPYLAREERISTFRIELSLMIVFLALPLTLARKKLLQ